MSACFLLSVYNHSKKLISHNSAIKISATRFNASLLFITIIKVYKIKIIIRSTILFYNFFFMNPTFVLWASPVASHSCTSYHCSAKNKAHKCATQRMLNGYSGAWFINFLFFNSSVWLLRVQYHKT